MYKAPMQNSVEFQYAILNRNVCERNQTDCIPRTAHGLRNNHCRQAEFSVDSAEYFSKLYMVISATVEIEYVQYC